MPEDVFPSYVGIQRERERGDEVEPAALLLLLLTIPDHSTRILYTHIHILYMRVRFSFRRDISRPAKFFPFFCVQICTHIHPESSCIHIPGQHLYVYPSLVRVYVNKKQHLFLFLLLLLSVMMVKFHIHKHSCSQRD